jgi:hypothetical protein
MIRIRIEAMSDFGSRMSEGNLGTFDARRTYPKGIPLERALHDVGFGMSGIGLKTSELTSVTRMGNLDLTLALVLAHNRKEHRADGRVADIVMSTSKSGGQREVLSPQIG